MHIGNAARVLRVLAGMTVALPVALFAIVAWTSWDDHFARAREDLFRAAAINREHAAKVFETLELVAEQLGESQRNRPDAEVRADRALHLRLRELVDRFDQMQNIWIIGADGVALAAASVFPAPPIDASDREYFRVFREGRMPAEQAHVSGPIRGRQTGQVFFQITRMRERDGGDPFDGVTGISIDPGYFQRFYAAVAAGRFGAMGLTREDGVLLARFPAPAEPLDRIARSENFARAVRDRPERGFIEAVSPIEGVPRLNAYSRLPAHPVYVTVTLDRSAVVDGWRAAMAQHLVFGLPATLALLALTLIALRFTRQGAATLANLRSEVARREAVESQLRQAQKMEAVGRLTGGIAHDFNNLLTVILGNLDLLRRRLDEAPPAVARAIEDAATGAARAASLTGRLLAFSRQQPLEPAPVDVNRLVTGMSELLRRTLGETISVETVLAGGLWRAHVDPNQLENAILNLAVNARDAMRDAGGKLTIETANARLDEDYSTANDQVAPGPYVLVAVSDTGAGMPRDVAAKAFEPFFTTKPAGAGTGLGLSQVYGFVKQSGGHVAIYSEVGQGTTVKLYLPRLAGDPAESAAGAPEAAAPAAAPATGQTVLVVEDDAMVRRFSVEALEEAGHRVLQAADAAQALALVEAHPEIRLVFTDVVLAGDMNGRALADLVATRRPGLPVLFTTGYSRNAIIHHGRLDEGVHFIGKPFAAGQLTAKVRELIGA